MTWLDRAPRRQPSLLNTGPFGGRAVSLVATVSAAGGTDVAFVFRFVFLTAWIFLAIGLIALILMAERPLRTSTVPAEPKASPPQRPVPAE